MPGGKTLPEVLFTQFRRLIPRPGEDGCGGYDRLFGEGEAFSGAAVSVGERNTGGGPVTAAGGRYLLTAERNAPLRSGDYIYRTEDGAVFRISGEIRRTPEAAGIGLLSAEAERLGGLDGVWEDGSPLRSAGLSGEAGSEPKKEAEA